LAAASFLPSLCRRENQAARSVRVCNLTDVDNASLDKTTRRSSLE
jgi:hypothetical protein